MTTSEPSPDEFTNSRFADTLNALVDMQESLLYAARRPVLNAAERAIVQLESEVHVMKSALNSLVDVDDALQLAVADFLRDYECSAPRFEAAKRINACAAALGITARAAISKVTGSTS